MHNEVLFSYKRMKLCHCRKTDRTRNHVKRDEPGSSRLSRFFNAYTHTWHEIYLFLFACPASPAMIYWVLKESIYQPKTLYLTWLSFKFEGKISNLRHSQYAVCFSYIKTAERKVKFKKQKRGGRRKDKLIKEKREKI